MGWEALAQWGEDASASNHSPAGLPTMYGAFAFMDELPSLVSAPEPAPISAGKPPYSNSSIAKA
jgi:hypothetical protein